MVVKNVTPRVHIFGISITHITVYPYWYFGFIMVGWYPFPWAEVIFLQLHIFIWESLHIYGFTWTEMFLSKLACCTVRYGEIRHDFDNTLKLHTVITCYPFHVLESNITQLEVPFEYLLLYRKDILIIFISYKHYQVEIFVYMCILIGHLGSNSGKIYPWLVGPFNIMYWSFF